MLLGSLVHCLLSLWVCGAPTRPILGAFWSFIGLPWRAFGCLWGPLGWLWGFIWVPLGTIAVPLGLLLGAFGLEWYCGEQESVCWSLFCPQTPIYNDTKWVSPSHAGSTERYMPVPCGLLKEHSRMANWGPVTSLETLPWCLKARWRIIAMVEGVFPQIIIGMEGHSGRGQGAGRVLT